MSASNAAAIRRRVNNVTNQQNSNVNTSNVNTSNVNTSNVNINKNNLLQFITNLDTRIKHIEDTLNNYNIVDDLNTRFELLVNEIGNIKDSLLKLQTFTMDVNKTLFDERINILSDNTNEEIKPDDE